MSDVLQEVQEPGTQEPVKLTPAKKPLTVNRCLGSVVSNFVFIHKHELDANFTDEQKVLFETAQVAAEALKAAVVPTRIVKTKRELTPEEKAIKEQKLIGRQQKADERADKARERADKAQERASKVSNKFNHAVATPSENEIASPPVEAVAVPKIPVGTTADEHGTF